MLAPEIFEGRQINVSVELAGTLTAGMTVADWWQITDRPRNVFYVRNGDATAYYDLLIHSLGNLP
jgi:purine nucleosidase